MLYSTRRSRTRNKEKKRTHRFDSCIRTNNSVRGYQGQFAWMLQQKRAKLVFKPCNRKWLIIDFVGRQRLQQRTQNARTATASPTLGTRHPAHLFTAYCTPCNSKPGLGPGTSGKPGYVSRFDIGQMTEAAYTTIRAKKDSVGFADKKSSQ
jgi:hypothetical protein